MQCHNFHDKISRGNPCLFEHYIELHLEGLADCHTYLITSFILLCKGNIIQSTPNTVRDTHDLVSPCNAIRNENMGESCCCCLSNGILVKMLFNKLKTLSIKNTKYEPFQTINAIPLCMVKKQSRPPFSLKNVLSKENCS